MSWSLVFWLLLAIFLMWKAGRMTWNKMEQMLMDWSWLLRTEARDVLAERESDPRQDKGHCQKPCPSKNTPCERKSSIPPVSQFSHLNPLTPPRPQFFGRPARQKSMTHKLKWNARGSVLTATAPIPTIKKVKVSAKVAMPGERKMCEDCSKIEPLLP